MNEILYVSDTYKQSRNFLQELAEDLSDREIAFKIDWKSYSLETDFYKIICESINSSCLGRNNSNVKFLANCAILHRDDVLKRIMLREEVKNIESREQIISLLMGGGLNGRL